LFSAVGNDERGKSARQILQSFGVNTDHVITSQDAPTGTVTVILDDSGHPDFAIQENVAWDHLTWNTSWETPIRNADAIYFGTLGQRCERSKATIHKALSLAKAAGIPRILDVNLRPPFYTAKTIRDSVELCSILKISEEEWPEVCAACHFSPPASVPEALMAFREIHGLDLLAMTRGSRGAILVSQTHFIEQPGIPTRVVDTVGAGDSFTAAMVVSLLRGDDPAAMARAACERAAMVCAQSGAVPLKSNL
jgi:fructokinase